MAEALGGKVAKAKAGWCVGVHEFKVFRIKQWMRPAKTKVNFLMICCQSIQLKNGIDIAHRAILNVHFTVFLGVYDSNIADEFLKALNSIGLPLKSRTNIVRCSASAPS